MRRWSAAGFVVMVLAGGGCFLFNWGEYKEPAGAGGGGGQRSSSGSVGGEPVVSSTSSSSASVASTSVTSTSAGSTSTSTASSSSGTICVPPDCTSCATCKICVACLNSGFCAGQYMACEANAACKNLLSCLQKCGGKACQNTCLANNPPNATYNALDACDSACGWPC